MVKRENRIRHLILGGLFFCFSSAEALVLEDLIQKGTLESTLKNKRVGYYTGSFDPLHRGHEAVAQLVTQKGLSDFVIMAPLWGGDTYKTRIDVKWRQDMLFSRFENHPTVIVTRLSPHELQQALTIPSGDDSFVKPRFGMAFVGIIGSDSALWYADHEEAFDTLMRGIEIPEAYQAHTQGGLMALPVQSFVVALREGDDIRPLTGKIHDREIRAVIESKAESAFSSSAVKEALRADEPIDSMVSDPVRAIIAKGHFYR